MDLDIEKIHSILIDADLPSSINDLTNPGEKYFVKLISAFLTKFYIDVNVIENLTIEQQQVMPCFDDSDIIGIINLYAAISQISDKIFLNELHITDITSPGPKRIRKQAKILANFFLYTTTKTAEIEDIIEDIYNRRKVFEDLVQKNNAVLETINERALHISKQLSEEEKIEAEIEKLREQIENEKKNIAQLDIIASDAEEKKQAAVQHCGSLKAEAMKVNKLLAEAQLNIVKSPEEYQTRLHKLEEQSKQKAEERMTMQEAFQAKKQLIDQKEKILAFIQNQHEKCPQIKKAGEELIAKSIEEKNIKDQLQTLQANINEVMMQTTTHKDQCGATENEELNAEYINQVSSLRNLHVQLQSTKKSMETKLGEERSRVNEALLTKNQLTDTIKKLEEETSLLIRNYQNQYDYEISKEKQFQKYFL